MKRLAVRIADFILGHRGWAWALAFGFLLAGFWLHGNAQSYANTQAITLIIGYFLLDTISTRRQQCRLCGYRHGRHAYNCANGHHAYKP